MTDSTNPFNALVSVVVPVLNGAPYLRECLNSVVEQTYRNWELIILDNASDDETPEIIEEYVAKDSRIFGFRNPEVYPMLKNHNLALQKMSSESVYCKPLMADDWLFPECLETMVRHIATRPNIGLVCALGLAGSKVICDGWPYPASSVSGREVARRHLENRGLYIFGSPTSTLFRSSVVLPDKPFYPEDNIAADFEACLSILQHADLAFVHQVLIYQRVHSESATSETLKLESGVAGRYCTFLRWGRKFLTDKEFDRAFKDRTDAYYRALALRAFRRPGKEFWRYQTLMLKRNGQRLSKWRLMSSMFKQILLWALSPGETLRRVYWYLSR